MHTSNTDRQEQELLELLKDYPMPEASAGFYDQALIRALTDGPPGIYNVAGDGTMTMAEIVAALGKRPRRIPARLLRTALAVLKPLRLSPYGPEQVGFLQYRPVLDNSRLKAVFGYVPKKTSREAFEVWRQAAQA